MPFFYLFGSKGQPFGQRKETAPELVETFKTFTDMVNAADAITDNMDNRYEDYPFLEEREM